MNAINELLTKLHVAATIQALLLILVGYVVARIVSRTSTHIFQRRLSIHQSMLFRRIVFYVIFLLFVTSAIQQLGFTITALLGATGIITVAVGIAAQASMSNVISGLFIIGEKPFEIGDTIKVSDMQGEVIAIDYLSVKIRTPDNTMIRIPNETLIKSPITNVSFFPKRRADFSFNLPFKTNLEHLKELFINITKNNVYCLQDPTPTVTIMGLTENGMNVQFSVWSKKENFNDLKNSIQADINQAFLEDKIDISISSQLFTLQAHSPLPIQFISEKE